MKAIIAAVAVLAIAIGTSVWQGPSTESSKLAASAPLFGQNEEMVSLAVGKSDDTTLVSTQSQDKRKREANCQNPVVKTSEPTSVEFRNEFLIKGMEAFQAKERELGVSATEAERELFIQKLAAGIPTVQETETVFVDEADSPGVITDEESDPTDVENDRVKTRVKRGCRGNDRAGSAQLVSFSTVAYNNSVGWKSCSKTVSFKALNGLTVGKLRLVSEWYNNVFQVPQWIEARATGTAYYLWSTDGDEDLRIARPYQRYPNGGAWYAYQNRAWQDFKYAISVGIGGVGGSVILDTHTLYVAHVVGPGGRCL